MLHVVPAELRLRGVTSVSEVQRHASVTLIYPV